MDPRILVTDHQSLVPVDTALLQRLAERALPLALEETGTSGRNPLAVLGEVEVSVVDDARIADVHQQFMNIPGPTDVITFEHGEIIVSAETAVRNGKRFGNSSDRELALYIVHGLLHLNGHEDDQPEVRKQMHEVQEKILKELWPSDGN